MDGDNSAPHPAGDAEAVRETFDQVPIVLGGFQGRDNRFDAANAAYRAFMGRSDVIGRPALEAFPEVAGQMLDLFDRIWDSGQPTSVQEWRFQFDRGGTGELDEVFMNMVLAPRRAADGTMAGVTVVATEVTEQVRARHEAQRQAVEAEQRYQAARSVVVEVQEALLSTSLPILPGAEVAAGYLVASDDQAAGGDWFDAVPLPDGTVAVLVGDIVGHGVVASAAMGQLRSVLNTVLTETGNLEQALAWADAMATRSMMMRAATVCAAVLDPVTGSVRYSTCGHPPPLIATTDGSTRYIEPSGSGPLGTGSTPVIAEEMLRVGDVLLLFTDGLVERSGQPLDVRLDALATVVSHAVANQVMPVGAPPLAVERACQQSIELLTRAGYNDDVTALAVQRRSAPIAPLDYRMAADPAELASLRAAVHDWLQQLAPTTRDEWALDLAVAELAANVIEHAYPPDQPGTMRCHAALGVDGILQVQVSDDGTWQQPISPADTSGRGLWLAGAALDELRVEPDKEHGTTVTIRHRLRRPAIFTATPHPTSGAQPVTEFTTDLDEGPPRVLRVAGALDISTAGEFAKRIAMANRGGVFPIVIDLSDVEILASAAIRVLFRARDEYTAHAQSLILRATPGSVADQVLKLVGLKPQEAS